VTKLAGVITVTLLSRLLAPADFGAFAVLRLLVGLASLLADGGISAALVQRAKSLSPADERTGFTLRTALGLTLAATLFLGAGLAGRLYDLDVSAVWVLRLYALEPLVGALGVVPGARLTRALRFDHFAWVETTSSVIGQAATIGLAWWGAGLWSLVIGALLTTAVGTALVNVLSPWRPRLGLTGESARSLMVFGLASHGRGLAHIAKDEIVPALGGLVLSTTQVGYFSWAQRIARWPRVPADYVARVGFPAFARLQRDPKSLSSLVQKSLTLVCALSFSAAAVALAISPLLVRSLFGPQWEPAIPALLILLAQTPLDALIAVLLPLIYAIGKAKEGLCISLAWAALTWLLSLSLLFVWRDGRQLAIPLAVGLATLCAMVLVVRCLPISLRVRWRIVVGGPLLLALMLGGGTRIMLGVIE
jgi:O-antigen/teichoic acid export membrane protein